MPYSAINLKMLRVLILGATGVFGSRLVERLAREPGFELVLSARGREKLSQVAADHAPDAAIRPLDRNKMTGADLTGIDIVIDTSGPFQTCGTQVIEAALAARVHYIDLADSRDFVAAISCFDDAAKLAGIGIVSGASSVPALSHAVIDHLTAGWQRIDTIKVGIFPGNRAPRGLAVVESILSYAGKPIRVFREGQWQNVPGWGMTHCIHTSNAGMRWASVCDTPDQDLLVARYRPTRAAEFFAGVELSIMHLGLLLLSLPVRVGLIESLLPAARILHRLAVWLRPFGSDKGAMTVEVNGVDAEAKHAKRYWSLDAVGRSGPYIPILAVIALLRRLRDGQALLTGAYACAGILTLGEFDADLDDLRIDRSFGN
ncbi:MAG: saccharopine dehydrogenase NADP-binding domain-containing protein [Sphingorhabdus sp.]